MSETEKLPPARGEQPAWMTEARDALIAWLGDVDDPIARARIGAMLVDQDTIAAVGTVRRAAVYQATRTTPRAAVADELGVSVSAVAKAILEHNAATKG